ncbi:MAG: hypothetical protein AAGA60_31205 [Cyanobacteria bacterium P01_E01_bin.42]
MKEVKAGFRSWLDRFVERKIDAENISDRLPQQRTQSFYKIEMHFARQSTD